MKLSSQSNHLVICKHCVYSFLNTLMHFSTFQVSLFLTLVLKLTGTVKPPPLPRRMRINLLESGGRIKQRSPLSSSY